MRIKRLKLFSYRDPDPSRYMFDVRSVEYDVVDESGDTITKTAFIRVIIEESSNYKTQMKSLQAPIFKPLRDFIKKMISGLKKGCLYSDQFYPNLPRFKEDTHSLGRDTAKYNSKGELTEVVWSKSIDGVNRLNYRIYKPEFNYETHGYTILIVLDSIIDRGLNGGVTYGKQPRQKKFSHLRRPRVIRLVLKSNPLHITPSETRLLDSRYYNFTIWRFSFFFFSVSEVTFSS